MEWELSINPILVIFQAREIPEFKIATDKLKIDKLYIKFFPQDEAYENARSWFLNRKEYTHFVILPDDLIVTQKDIDMLAEDTKKYKIISGWSNNTAGTTDDVDTDFSLEMPVIQTEEYEPYHFLPIAEIPKRDIIPVVHQGTALTFLPRDIIERIEFRKDIPPDLGLSISLYERAIPQYVDTRVRLLHLRRPDILVGKRKQEVVYCKQ